jgi:hypothetical protein
VRCTESGRESPEGLERRPHGNRRFHAGCHESGEPSSPLAGRWRRTLAALLLACAAAPAAAAEETANAPAAPPRYVQLGPPATPHNAAELRLQLAQRLVAAHPDTTYLSPTPERLWAIPVLEVELNANGGVRKIVVLRHPTTGDEATALAIAAVRRAAPYGNVARLPKPWKVVETFLFDDDLRFKPRTLDTD